MKIKYNQNPHQVEFAKDIKTKQLLLTSGYGAGKSYALIMKMLHLSYLNRGYDGGLFAPSLVEYKRDLLPLMREILDDNNIQHNYHQTDKWWIFPWSKGKIHVFTCEKRIRGPNLAYAGINEPGLIPFDRYKEILGRVRIGSAQHPQIALAGTPEGKSHWLYSQFVDPGGVNRRVIYGNTTDNPHLHEDYIETLEENYDQIMLQAYLHGKFVNMNGAMFYYAFTREKNCDKRLVREPSRIVHIGMDFNVDNMCCTMWHVDNGHAYCFDEIHLPKNQDTNKLCIALKARGYKPEDCIVYPDPSGKARSTSGFADINIIKNHGFLRVKYKPKAPSFRDRQLCVNNLLDKERIKINPDKCKKLLRDLEAVEQEVSDFAKIKDNPDLTHASDGMDYMIDILFPLSGTKPISTSRR